MLMKRPTKILEVTTTIFNWPKFFGFGAVHLQDLGIPWAITKWSKLWKLPKVGRTTDRTTNQKINELRTNKPTEPLIESPVCNYRLMTAGCRQIDMITK